MKIAAVQMVSTPRWADNQASARALLEQAAAQGVELAVLPEYFGAIGARVIGCEVDPIRAAMCEAKGHSVMRMNFLETQPVADFDMVVMNPPFYGRHYAKHVRHALRFLKPGGTLRAILPATARHDHGLLDDLKPQWEDLPVGAFSESGTNICTTICTIRKQKEARQ